MQDWNVVVTVFQEGYRRALRALRALGSAERSPYHNVLVMKAEDPMALLAAVEACTDESPALYDAISRVAPAQRTFDFGSTADFLDVTKSIVCEWTPRLAGRRFHVRVHRRGMGHDLHTQDIENRLDTAILDGTASMGSPSSIGFTDMEAMIAVDTIDHRAGVSLWTREDLACHRLLRPD